MALSEAEKRQLDEQGYLVLEGLMGGDLLARLRRRVDELFEKEGDRAGWEFLQEPGARRLANLANKGDVFLEVLSHPVVLERVAHVLGPEFKLSSLNARSARPHNSDPQPLHVDMGAIPDERGYWVCNTIWILDDFTTDNGATRIVPGSHRWGKLPAKVLREPTAPHPREVLVTGPAGTVVIMNAHAWHGGTANRSDTWRCAVHGFFCRWDKPQQQYQKRMVDAYIQEQLSPELRRLLALDDELNDQLSSSVIVRSGFMK